MRNNPTHSNMAKGHPTIRPPNLDPDLLNVPSPDSEKSSRAASSLLANLWQYSKLHRDFRAVCSTEPGNRDLGCGVQGADHQGWGGTQAWNTETRGPGYAQNIMGKAGFQGQQRQS